MERLEQQKETIAPQAALVHLDRLISIYDIDVSLSILKPQPHQRRLLADIQKHVSLYGRKENSNELEHNGPEEW